MPELAYLILFGRLESLPKVEDTLVDSSQGLPKECRRIPLEIEYNGCDPSTVTGLLQACDDRLYQWREPLEDVADVLADHANRKEWAIVIWRDESDAESICCACTPANLKDFVLFDELLDEAQQTAFRAFARKQAVKLAKENP